MGFSEIRQDRLHQFKQAGYFNQVRGSVLGYSTPKEGFSVEDLLADVTAGEDLPIVKCDDYGHHCPNTLLRVSSRCRLNRDSVALEILQPYVA